MFLSLAFATAFALAGCGNGVEPDDGGFCLFHPCADLGYTAAEATNSAAPHEYTGNLFLSGEDKALGFVLKSSAPVPDFVGEYTWGVALVISDDSGMEGLTVIAEPMMPAHGHGTLPQYTEAVMDADGVHVLDAMNLYMPGVWEIRLSAYDDEGLVDSASFFFELE